MVDYGFHPVRICGLGARSKRTGVAIYLNIDFVEYLFPGSTSPPSNPTFRIFLAFRDDSERLR